MNKKIADLFSNCLVDSPGGSTAGAGIAGVSAELLRAGIRPKVYIVTSVSSLFTLQLALSVNHKYDYLKRIALSETIAVNMKKMFGKYPPFNSKGKISWSAIWRLITNKIGLGVQDTSHYITDHVTHTMFDEYKKSDEYAHIYVSMYNYKTRSIEYRNLKNLTYKQMIDVCEASAYMPMVAPRIIEDQNGIPTAYYDGGWIDKNASVSAKPILERHNIQNVVSIYHHQKQRSQGVNHIPKSNMEVLKEYATSLMHQHSLADEKGMALLVEQMDKINRHHTIRIDNLTQSFYDTDPTRLTVMQSRAILETKKYLKSLAL